MGPGKALLLLVTVGALCLLTTQQDCPRGFRAEGKVCEDEDECKEDKDLCGKKNVICSNTVGSYYCLCDPGFMNNIQKRVNFTGLHGECKDRNECTEERHICGTIGTCNNTMGSYECTCPPGYKNRNHSRSHCIDRDECNGDETRCGRQGTCINTIGSYWCKCEAGYTNYTNERTPCSAVTCDQFKEDGKPAHSLVGLAAILSLMRNSCEAMSNVTSPHHNSSGKSDGVALLEKLLTATDSLLSPGLLGDNDTVSVLLHTVEDAMRFIGPQLKDPHTTMASNETEVKFAVRRGEDPPKGPFHLATTNVSLDADWGIATGNGTYPGFALAALVSYKNLEKSCNQSFDLIKGQNQSHRYQIFSKVVSALVSNPSTQSLDPPVTLTFRHLEERKESPKLNYTCVYWRAEPGEEGAWSTEGCTRQSSNNSTHTTCVCTHLSSFAVLMALYDMPDPVELRVLTQLGLALSLVCLLLCVLTFRFCRSIQGTRNTIHLHLCLCLFVADFIFLVGISRTEPEGGCALVAGLLHYFFLAALTWMLLEGVQLYRMVVLVFNSNMRPLYLYAVGYGAPLAIVVISALSRPSGYGTERHCWLSQGLIWSFFGPVCLIIVLNVFFFCITVWKLAQKFSSLNPDLSDLRKIKAFTVTAIAQMCVLGLMWVFGAFLFEEGTMVEAYIFTILNSLQGALVFVMHCLLSKQVRDEYANFFSCICKPQKKKYWEFSSTNNPSSGQSQSQQSRSQSAQNTGESHI